ncbi:hypothetical protein Tco_0593119 [Tanacetum coccineum]
MYVNDVYRTNWEAARHKNDVEIGKYEVGWIGKETKKDLGNEHEAPPIVTTPEEQTSPIPLNEADENNQEDSADFDGNTVVFPYDVLNFEEAESSTTALDPSNMHEFHQVQPSTHI